MKTSLSLLAEFITTVFAAEFAAGFIHWLEDAYIHHHGLRYLTRTVDDNGRELADGRR